MTDETRKLFDITESVYGKRFQMATDAQKDKILELYGDDEEVFLRCKNMKFAAAEALISYREKKTQEDKLIYKYTCPICKKGFDSPRKTNKVLNFLLFILFLFFLSGIPASFVFGGVFGITGGVVAFISSLTFSIIIAVISSAISKRVCPNCGSTTFYKNDKRQENKKSTESLIVSTPKQNNNAIAVVIISALAVSVFAIICFLIEKQPKDKVQITGETKINRTENIKVETGNLNREFEEIDKGFKELDAQINDKKTNQ